MEVCKPPSSSNLEENSAEIWKEFEDRLQIFLDHVSDGSEASEKAGKVEVAIQLCHVGTEAQKVYKTFRLNSKDDKKDFEKVVKQFREYCV